MDSLDLTSVCTSQLGNGHCLKLQTETYLNNSIFVVPKQEMLFWYLLLSTSTLINITSISFLKNSIPEQRYIFTISQCTVTAQSEQELYM